MMAPESSCKQIPELCLLLGKGHGHGCSNHSQLSRAFGVSPQGNQGCRSPLSVAFRVRDARDAESGMRDAIRVRDALVHLRVRDVGMQGCRVRDTGMQLESEEDIKDVGCSSMHLKPGIQGCT